MITFSQIMMVALGGMAGSLLRFLAGVWISQWWAGNIWPTLVVNLLGSFAFGAILALLSHDNHLGQYGRLLLLTGFCGGFTTFSALSYEVWQLFKTQQYGQAIGYYLGSGIGGVALLALAFFLFQPSAQS